MIRLTCMCGRTFGAHLSLGETATLSIRRVDGQCVTHWIEYDYGLVVL